MSGVPEDVDSDDPQDSSDPLPPFAGFSGGPAVTTKKSGSGVTIGKCIYIIRDLNCAEYRHLHEKYTVSVVIRVYYNTNTIVVGVVDDGNHIIMPRDKAIIYNWYVHMNLSENIRNRKKDLLNLISRLKNKLTYDQIYTKYCETKFQKDSLDTTLRPATI